MARILLVEDDRFTRELYELLLVESGYQVDVAVDGKKGFSKAAEGGYDLILLDIILPKKDGLSILKDLQKITPKKENKKIVMLTVLNQDEFIKTALKSGADGYLMKSSLKPNEVLAEIKSFLGENP
jgi:DNA-binding response OmpR family regulator